ncbi:TPA: hypothetical protein R8G72_004437 [Citrobacter youngae]|nr:hypothetical protein [Citrobacter youngae]HEF0074278.1 hypothetical protein [Citrobacter youngae]
MIINLCKKTLSLIDKKRYELLRHTQYPANREEMVKLVIQKGLESLTLETLEGMISISDLHHPGVFFYNKLDVELRGILWRPDPNECASILKEMAPCFVAVFGEPGSGVTTLVNEIATLSDPGVMVCDDGKPNKINTAIGVNAFLNKRSVLTTMTARGINDVIVELSQHSLFIMPDGKNII